MSTQFYLEILTPERKFFTGLVEAVIIPTPSGEMEILHQTFPMVVALKSGIMRIMQNEKWMEAANAEGFVRVSPNGVIIMAQLCAWPYEVINEKDDKDIIDLDCTAKKEQSLKEYKLAKAQLAVQIANLKRKKTDL